MRAPCGSANACALALRVLGYTRDESADGVPARIRRATRANRPSRIRTLLIQQRLAAVVGPDGDHANSLLTCAIAREQRVSHNCDVPSSVVHTCAESCDTPRQLRQLQHPGCRAEPTTVLTLATTIPEPTSESGAGLYRFRRIGDSAVSARSLRPASRAGGLPRPSAVTNLAPAGQLAPARCGNRTTSGEYTAAPLARSAVYSAS